MHLLCRKQQCALSIKNICYRTLLASLLLCGAATSTLVWAPSSDTVLLFLGRAAVMASYTTLYVYTPEVSSADLGCLYMDQVQPFGWTLDCPCSGKESVLVLMNAELC